MPDRPRHRDAGIIMLVAAAIGALLGIDILADALDASPTRNDTIAWSVLLIDGAAVLGVVGWRVLRRKNTPLS